VRDRGDRGADLLGKGARLLLASVEQQDEELLAAVAADEVAGTDRGPVMGSTGGPGSAIVAVSSLDLPTQLRPALWTIESPRGQGAGSSQRGADRGAEHLGQRVAEGHDQGEQRPRVVGAVRRLYRDAWPAGGGPDGTKDARQPVVQGRSFSGFRTAQMCLIRSPTTSNASTAMVTPSS
jgi:hypothetical protein